jgi:acyl-coenzyme A synthetase/AMP-(fatty) acid ligase
VSLHESGRLLVRSDAVADSYEIPRDDDLLGEGVHLTRDLATIDAGGQIRLTGTTGGAINVAGRKVSPSKVEAAILATGLVTSVRVSAIPSADPERHEEIAAEITLAPGVSLDHLKSAAAERLQSWEIPRHWR